MGDMRRLLLVAAALCMAFAAGIQDSVEVTSLKSSHKEDVVSPAARSEIKDAIKDAQHRVKDAAHKIEKKAGGEIQKLRAELQSADGPAKRAEIMNKIDSVKIRARKALIKETGSIQQVEKDAITGVEHAAWKREQRAERKSAKRAITGAIEEAKQLSLSHRLGSQKLHRQHKSAKPQATADKESTKQRIQKAISNDMPKQVKQDEAAVEAVDVDAGTEQFSDVVENVKLDKIHADFEKGLKDHPSLGESISDMSDRISHEKEGMASLKAVIRRIEEDPEMP